MSTSSALDLLGEGWERILIPRKDGKRYDPSLLAPNGRKYRNYSQLSKLFQNSSQLKEIILSHENSIRSLFRVDDKKQRKQRSKESPHPRSYKPILPKPDNNEELKTNEEEQIQLLTYPTTVVLDPPEFDFFADLRENKVETCVVASQNMEYDGLNVIIDSELTLTHSDEVEMIYKSFEEIEKIPLPQSSSKTCEENLNEDEDEEFIFFSDHEEEAHCDHNYQTRSNICDINLDIDM